MNFNPRSLAGATIDFTKYVNAVDISIHAPLRERRYTVLQRGVYDNISIHAPLRERLSFYNLPFQ